MFKEVAWWLWMCAVVLMCKWHIGMLPVRDRQYVEMERVTFMVGDVTGSTTVEKVVSFCCVQPSDPVVYRLQTERAKKNLQLLK